MKYLLLFAVFAAILSLLYLRLRPYVLTARRILRLVSDARKLSADDPSAAAPRRANRPGEKLLRCETCGTWLPASRALSHRGPAHVYCSHACLERAADAPRSRKSAS